ncbi:MAG: hypothetical protein AAFX08_09705 [Pseudomonadota bacterium]
MTLFVDLAAAVAVATMGVLWFAYVLKGLKGLGTERRNVVYGGIWLAYFFLTLVLASRLGEI